MSSRALEQPGTSNRHCCVRPTVKAASLPSVPGDRFGSGSCALGRRRDAGRRRAAGGWLPNQHRRATKTTLTPDAGAVYIFVRNGTTYELQTYLKPTPGPFDTAHRGRSLRHVPSLLQPTVRRLVVGAPLAEPGIRPVTLRRWCRIRVHARCRFMDAARDTRWAACRWQCGRPVRSRRWRYPSDGSTIAVGAPFDDGDRAPGTRTPTLRSPVPRTSSRRRIACSGCARRT